MKPIRFRRRTSRAALALALVLGACDSPTEPPTMASVSGSYAATTLALSGGVNMDLLAAGGELRLDLAVDGTTSGRLFLPGADDDGGDLDANLSGKWTLKGDTVRFEQNADTFVRDTPFLVRGARLEADRSEEGIRVRVVLSRK